MNRNPVPDSQEDVDAVIRPFVLTRGRTESTLPVEALCVATSRAVTGSLFLTGEERDLLALCEMPQSVAELAAKAGLPLGVCRVLLSDLAEREHVYVSQHEGIDVDLDLIGRLLDGIRRA